MFQKRYSGIFFLIAFATGSLLSGCAFPAQGRSGSAAATDLKLNFVVSGRSPATSGSRLILPTADTLTVTLTGEDGQTLPTSRSATLSSSDSTVSLSFDSVAQGIYTIAAEARNSVGELVFAQTSSGVDTKKSGTNITLNLLPATTEQAGFDPIGTAGLFSPTLAAGASKTYTVAEAARPATGTTWLLSADPSILVFVQAGDGRLLSTARLDSLDLSASGDCFVTLYNSGSVGAGATLNWNKPYTVTYNTASSDGGTAPSAASVLPGATLALPAADCGLTRAGCTLIAWTTATDGSAALYTPGSQLSGLTGDTTLYPVFLTTGVTYSFTSGTTGLSITGSESGLSTASLYLPEGTTGIETSAFNTRSGLSGILNFPATLQSIGETAFSSCTALTGLTLPPNVTFLGLNAFSDCTAITGNLTIPASVTTMGAGAFFGCTGLTGVTINASITFLAANMFNGCTSMTSATLPPTLTDIGSSAFKGCSSLASVNIPEGVSVIQLYAFQNAKLTSLVLPSTITSLEYYAFYNNTSLTSIEIHALIPPDAMSYSLSSLGTNQIKVPTSAVAAYTAAKSTNVEYSPYTFVDGGF